MSTLSESEEKSILIDIVLDMVIPRQKDIPEEAQKFYETEREKIRENLNRISLNELRDLVPSWPTIEP